MPRGETPQYTGATPVKAETEQYTYAFSGWTPAIVPVAGNAEYRATYAATEKPGTYTTVSGSGGTWTKESGEVVVFSFKRSFNDDETFGRFTDLQADGESVSPTDASGNANYTVERGSAVVTLNPTYLETLSLGTHEFKAVFDDAVSEGATLAIAAAPEPDDGDKADDKTDDKTDGKADNSNSNAKTKATTKGSTSAKTGDAIPIVALCALAMAGALTALVTRRRLRAE